jgi:DNA integrity scanning protein DisA with diadenylate cyclase activity
LSIVRSGNEISLYTGELTDDGIKSGLKHLSLAFPDMPKEFFIILSERIKANNFTDKRLHDSIEYLIDTNLYPKITVASVIGYDKKIKLKTYQEIIKEGSQFYGDKPGKMFDLYRKYKKYKDNLGEYFLYVSIVDVENYHLTTL